ncbi:MAG: hypothetical protein IKJ01_07715, partial [Lachnospiraceae bacterium]|nr:hypothetical protein [Lachnospiraceae bacterium]
MTKTKKNIIITTLLLSIVSSSLLGCQSKADSITNQKEVSGYSEKDIPMPDGFSKKQQKELKKIYKKAYEDEKKALELAVIEAINHFDKYGELKQDFKNLLGTTEDFYQTLNNF